MKIVAQSEQDPDPRFDIRYFVVVDDDYEVTKDEGFSPAWIISAESPELRPVWNGTMLLGHGGWYPFTGDQAVLQELLAAGAYL